ncbi:arginine--tRNA ligase [Lacrimispora saccharolytica]|uniref:Arginine--tRNA ligase n=1 Tax=Lacrimispora saccharolytica (strain ATCC 35040 / DSM 2544 / NRCC 2533 / WM1) TaxID=610130 RepID=D9R3E4_LACSW|nr:arginine--tRNA ligase [Lacrimispora saccharolytica]ADL04893.1 arginyl-tRNA synthetase [[Clostridium] saccharolyticum WM1]QRV20899.1 arginine--tRNA ligase [Lacrimispora saccharolytica]
MKKILDLITAEMKAAFADCGYDEAYAKVTLSNRPDLCEYQCNGAMAAAKAYKKKPFDIASEAVAKLTGSHVFASVDAVMPGFINLKLNSDYLAEYVDGMAGQEQCGCERTENPMTIVVDYGGANVAKPLHVGHLRSAIIGESIKRMGRFLGHQVIGDVHLGDWGLQMGLIIEELKDRKPELPYFDPSFEGEYPKEAPFTIGELEEIYPAASAKAKSDEEFSTRAHDATLKLQNGFRPYRAIWQHIIEVSVADLKNNYGNLNVSFDLWKGESDAEPYIAGLIKELEDQGLAYESQGALVVDIAEEGDPKELPPCIVRKSDGAALYSTSDLGTIIEREKEIKPDWYIYLTDKRQELHFVQVFRVAKKAGFVSQDKKMSHLCFGTMNGKDGKPFKTRDGGVMRLETLISDISQAAYEKIMENRTVSEKEAEETSKIVGMAALKYGDLSNQASKDYVFDMDRFVSFEGNTGPYILYTIVRIKSILAKYQGIEDKYQGEEKILAAATEAEKDLMLQLSRYNEIMETGFTELAPHKICQYIYELANAFNRFYHDTKIITEEDKKRQASWVRLIGLAKDVLNACIGVLGIEAPERM